MAKNFYTTESADMRFTVKAFVVSRITKAIAISTALILLSVEAVTASDLDHYAVEERLLDGRPAESLWDDRDFAGLVTALDRLSSHGLNPSDYNLVLLHNAKLPPEQRAKVAMNAWFSAATHMVHGKLNAKTIEPNWTAAKRDAALGQKLADALASNTVETSLEALAPKQQGYKALLSELARLRAEEAKGVTRITSGSLLRTGDRGGRVVALKTRLMELSLLTDNGTGDEFDENVKAAVIALQQESSLDADGVVGPATLRALNRGQSERIDQIRVNLERWRWLPDDLGRKHVRVNIAGFDLTAWENGKPVRTHRTIVGKTYRKTPIFSGEIQYIIFNPWWETPRSIAKRDKLPVFRRDPSVVRRQGFQVLDHQGRAVNPDSIDWSEVPSTNFPYRVRQAPGPDNALGHVKIMFPNRHNVYIHDTPMRGLFDQEQRAFSSGCIRTQDALDLASWLLRDNKDWSRTKIDEAVSTGRESRVNLSSWVPVHVLYSTAVAVQDGSVRYLDDIYERDAVVLAGLQRKPI